jgi:excisionase family DNA binding protein
MSDGTLLMTVREVAALTGFSEGTLRHWVSQRRIPFVRISDRCVRFLPADIQAWLAAKRVAPIANGHGLQVGNGTKIK